MSGFYEKRVSYTFEAECELFSITGDCDGVIEIEEVDKNGQEDCHRHGVLEKHADGKWHWAEGKTMFVTYGSKKQADEIVKYLNLHEPPKAE